jgi:hypothetical protein
MIDDVGTGPGSKFPLEKLDALPPTALIETSPDNYQAVYMFDSLITDQARFNALIDAFVAVKFLDKDTGMKGVTRVFRPPFGRNTKEKYGGKFQVRLAEWNPGNRYSYEDICFAFGLKPVVVGRVKNHAHIDSSTRIDGFEAVWNALEAFGMLKGDGSHDWTHITCPWVDEHTGGVDNGAGIGAPSEENGWYGAFRCHHGACADRGWKELADYISDACSELIDHNNALWAEKGWK